MADAIINRFKKSNLNKNLAPNNTHNNSDKHTIWINLPYNGHKADHLPKPCKRKLGRCINVIDVDFWISYISDSMSQGNAHLYADDATAFVIGNSTDEVVVKLNLLFEVMIMQKNRFVGPLLPVRCCDKLIEYTNKTKLLGVVIDNQREHVDKALKAFGNQIRALRKMSYLPLQLKKSTLRL